VPHLATPRKAEFSIPNASAPWTLRSAGGARPTLIVWGKPVPADSVLDRLARAGLAILTAPEHATSAELLAALEMIPAPVRVAFLETPATDVSKSLDAKAIPWRCVTSEWDEVPRWFQEAT